MKTVIEMARDAGCGHESIDLRWVMPKNLERFAALVREDERSLQHKIDYDQGFVDGVEEGRAMREREKQQVVSSKMEHTTQEPVAWLCECSPEDWNELNADERSVVIWNKDSLSDYEADGYSITPFYTTPTTAAEWEKLKDPVALHQNLLRGFPDQLTKDMLLHLLGQEYTGQPLAAIAARQMRDAAAKVCRELPLSVIEDGILRRTLPTDCEAAIAALPVPEVQWRELTDDEIIEAANISKEDIDDLDLTLVFKDVRAVIAKFKEKQL